MITAAILVQLTGDVEVVPDVVSVLVVTGLCDIVATTVVVAAVPVDIDCIDVPPLLAVDVVAFTDVVVAGDVVAFTDVVVAGDVAFTDVVVAGDVVTFTDVCTGDVAALTSAVDAGDVVVAVVTCAVVSLLNSIIDNDVVSIDDVGITVAAVVIFDAERGCCVGGEIDSADALCWSVLSPSEFSSSGLLSFFSPNAAFTSLSDIPSCLGCGTIVVEYVPIGIYM